MKHATQSAGRSPGLPVHAQTQTRKPVNCGSQDHAQLLCGPAYSRRYGDMPIGLKLGWISWPTLFTGPLTRLVLVAVYSGVLSTFQDHRFRHGRVPTKSPQVRVGGVGAHKKPTDSPAQSGTVRHGCYGGIISPDE